MSRSGPVVVFVLAIGLAACRTEKPAPTPDPRLAWVFEAPRPGTVLPDDARPCVTTGNPGQALSSAIAGLGRAELPLPLVEEAVAAGRLVILDGPEESRRGYWLVAPLPQWRQKKVKALVEHLAGE